jgi:hypothetical protein
MYMSTSSIKKVSAAAVAAVLGLAGISHAAPVSPIVLPYATNFPAAPAVDTNGESYTATSLYGQGNTVGATGGWVGETGEVANTVTVNGGGGVTMNSAYEAPVLVGSELVSQWSDVYNANLADHPAAGSNGTGAALDPSVNYHNNITVSYSLNIANGGSLGSDGAPAAGFGTRVLDQNDNLVAALFTEPPAAGGAPGEEDVYYQTGNTGAPINTLLVGHAGSADTYALNIDYTNKDFTVYVDGVADAGSTDIPFGAGLSGTELVGGIALSTDNLGTNSAVFSNFSVVPEPASIAMLGLGGLMLLAKRHTRQA